MVNCGELTVKVKGIEMSTIEIQTLYLLSQMISESAQVPLALYEMLTMAKIIGDYFALHASYTVPKCLD